MSIEYRHNPQYFKRKILQYVLDSTGNEILAAELRWLSMVKDEELGKRYYNRKNKNFGNTRGCTKSYVWNQGLTKAECDEYKLMRKNKLFCLLSEKPTRGTMFVHMLEKDCNFCSNKFFTKRGGKFCSSNCAGKFNGLLQRGKEKSKHTVPSWNKGIHNPTAAELGRRTAAKQSATVTGRKRAYKEDGSWFWIYPNKT